MIQLGQAALRRASAKKMGGGGAEWFGKAVKGNPKDAQAIACLGQTLCWQGKRKEGLIYLRKSGQLLLKKARKGGATELALDMANQLHHWKDYPGALELLKQVVQINPDVVRAQQLLGVTYLHLNQPKHALSAARKAVQLAADQAILAIQLAVLEAANGLLPEARQRLENILQKPNLSPEEKFRAHKELARILDKLGGYGQAFEHLQASAAISQQLPAVAKQDRNFVPQKLAHCKWSKATFPDELPAPVFLMGFMRTGTALTQEVLGAHPEVFVADETDLLVATVQELHRLSNHQGSMPGQLDKLDWAGVLHLRRFYWDRVRLLYGDQVGKRLLLDKTTMNTIEPGFAHRKYEC